MMRQVLRVAPVLAIGGAGAGALYWALLNTPDSNALMLATSALLLIALAAVVGITINASLLLALHYPLRRACSRAVRGIGWAVLAAVLFSAIWITVGRADAWTDAHAGEINAWFIAQFGWADMSWLLDGARWLSRWLRYAVAPAFVLVLVAHYLLRFDGRRMRRGSVVRLMAVATGVFVLLFALPWQLTAWRPQLPPTWIEPTVAALRIGTFLLLALLGAAILVIAAADARRPEPAHD